MGAVAMGTGGSYRFEGSLITQIAYCLYCDRCSSFRIGKRHTLKAFIWISIAAVITTVFYNSVKEGALPGAWLVCFASLVYFISMAGVLALGHRCKKCGSRHISMDNVLNYPENDRNILDVPYKRTIRYYRDDY